MPDHANGRRTRREFLEFVVGGAGLAGLAACGVGTSKPGLARPGAAFEQPTTLRSTNGKLTVRLVAKGRLVRFGSGRRFAYTYNDSTPGPTLRLRPGDVLTVTLVNQLDHPTNLHTHGLHVSPSGDADNVFVTVAPGASHTYVYEIPADHPSGLFWYHPHHHGTVAEQIFGGLAGAIVVEDELDELPAMAASRERVMVIADPPVTDDAGGFGASMMERMQGREGDVVTVNGIVAPTLRAGTGTLERWRVLNASASRYYRIALVGHPLHLIATDGGRLAAPTAVDELLLAPGERVEVLVVPTRAGRVALEARPYDRGSPMMMGGGGVSRHPTTTLATVVVRDGAGQPAGLPRSLAPARPTVAAPGRYRTVTLAMGMGGGGMGSGMGGGMGGMGGGGMSGSGFTIDGQSFDPARTDLSARLGTVEEWTVRNTSPMDHPFHLHVWPFRVLDPDGTVRPGWKDTVNVPANGSVTLRVAFRDIVGRTVYHCHILDHEDLGMMGVIDVS